jgi:hypothetical protein
MRDECYLHEWEVYIIFPDGNKKVFSLSANGALIFPFAKGKNGLTFSLFKRKSYKKK